MESASRKKPCYVVTLPTLTVGTARPLHEYEDLRMPFVWGNWGVWKLRVLEAFTGPSISEMRPPQLSNHRTSVAAGCILDHTEEDPPILEMHNEED